MQVWTKEKLQSAARLVELGVAPKDIARDIGVPLPRLNWIMSYRKDLFGKDEAKPVPPRRVREPDPTTAGRSLIALAATPRRKAEFEPGLDSFLAVPAAPVGQPVSLLQLTSRHCKWAIGRDASVGTLFCGGAAIEGKSWCACHARRVFEARAA